MTTTVQDDILDRIRSQGRGKVFIPKDFLDLTAAMPPTSRSHGWSGMATSCGWGAASTIISA
ncbi:hypothetical protein [Planctomicrobium sp. SH527]|uniref:hypothetical protein n=1 Tax=Planctomicrobium sp. SH527 TaxID=3448123 RepID=UPI003F5CA2F7